jgi:ankyrin repeat protein
VSLFIELGLDINLTDAAGRIPLHFAARAVPKNAGFIEFLLARGANAKAVDEDGQGVLHYAITVRHLITWIHVTRSTHATHATHDTQWHDTTRQALKFLMI